MHINAPLPNDFSRSSNYLNTIILIRSFNQYIVKTRLYLHPSKVAIATRAYLYIELYVYNHKFISIDG